MGEYLQTLDGGRLDWMGDEGAELLTVLGHFATETTCLVPQTMCPHSKGSSGVFARSLGLTGQPLTFPGEPLQEKVQKGKRPAGGPLFC